MPSVEAVMNEGGFRLRNQAAGANGQQGEIVVLILRGTEKENTAHCDLESLTLFYAFYIHTNYLETTEVRAVVSSSILLSP